jgi:hypothetical protein
MKPMNKLLSVMVMAMTIACNAPAKTIHLSDIKFTSIFGNDRKDSTQGYCLLGTGFFRAPTSKNSDSLIKVWMIAHPDAIVIPVSTLDEPQRKFTYCWLVDKGDTINNYLVKNGCFPGGTMMRPKTYKELSARMKSVMGKEELKVIVHIDKKVYDDFIEQIKQAEIYATEHKLGIWQEKQKDEEE